MAGRRVVVLGGAGVFGRLIAGRLARDETVEVVLAGRTQIALEAADSGIRASLPAPRLAVETLDIEAAGLAARLRDLAPAIVADATGPRRPRPAPPPPCRTSSGAAACRL